MSFQEIVEQLPTLSDDEKHKLLALLSAELKGKLFEEGAKYEVWSPFYPYEATGDSQRMLSKTHGMEVWSPQITDPDAMTFLNHLEKVLLTKGIEAANKLITREDKPSDGD